jgi:hypothetical protein
MAGFGWNFYGFFLFAALWIAGYFAWARWMAARDRRGARDGTPRGGDGPEAGDRPNP